MLMPSQSMTARNLPAQKQLLDHGGRQAAQEMASAVEHQDLPLRHLRQPPGKEGTLDAGFLIP